jgi:hypothetical protein
MQNHRTIAQNRNSFFIFYFPFVIDTNPVYRIVGQEIANDK